MDAIHEQDIPTVILLGTVGMLLLIGCMALFILMYQKRILKEKQKRALQELDYQSKMIRLQFESQEQERKRIGANLHDSLGSLLWGAKVNASLIQRSIELNDKALDSYKELTQILDDSIEEVRRISWELTPEAFHYSGLSQSVKKLCARLNGPNQKIEMSEVGGRLWNDERGLQVYRIAHGWIFRSKVVDPTAGGFECNASSLSPIEGIRSILLQSLAFLTRGGHQHRPRDDNYDASKIF